MDKNQRERIWSIKVEIEELREEIGDLEMDIEDIKNE